MSGQNGTVVNTNPADETAESESELEKQPFSSTENEQAFRGPKFSPPVYRRRYAAVCELAKEHQARKVLDFGCAEAKLVKALINQESLTHLEEVVGIDINRDLLEENKFRIKPLLGDYLRPRTHPFKVSLYQGSIAEVDGRFVDFDLIACVELIEHLEPDILSSMPEVVFGHLSPKVVIVTTPNVEFNVLFPGLKGFRHYDHKFEWTRAEFEEWCSSQASQYNYTVSFDGIAPGPQGTEHLGCCSQVAVFKRISSSVSPEKLLQTCQPYNLVAEVEYPFKRDTRTEKEKILHEVEYVLWILSSKEEEAEEGDDESTPSDEDVIELTSNDEGNNELTSSNDDDDKPTPSDEDVIELTSNDEGNNELTSSNDDDDKPAPSDEDVIELVSYDEGNNELTSSNDGDDKPTLSDDGVIKMTPNDEHNNKLTPDNDGNDEQTAYRDGVIEWTLNDEDNNELTPSNSGDDQPTPSEHNDNELSSSSGHSDKQSPKDYNDVMAEELQGFSDYSKSIDGVEERIYSLEKLLAFPSLHKLCGDDIQKLRHVLQDSPLFQLTEDGLGVLWKKPSNNWSSEESDGDWDACADEQELNKSVKYQKMENEEPENWENVNDDEVCTTSAALAPSLQSEVCWELPNDCCKFWNGKDWSEVEEQGTQEEEDECDTPFHSGYNVIIVQESDESLNNDSDENDFDGLVWMTEKSSVSE